jgi:competence protein ComEC
MGIIAKFGGTVTNTVKHIMLALTIAALFMLSACGILPDGAPPNTTSAHGNEAGLTVYFIDVGQADSALVLCGGAAMLIDGGNVADSDLIYAFLKNCGVTYLDYIVGTHAHEDHIGGLAGALNYATVGTTYCPVTEFDSKAFDSFVKYLGEQDKAITVPSPGDTFTLGGADVEILGPIRPSDEPNNMSIVLKLTYGDVSFLFTGDAERAEEADIIEAGYDLSVTVLKVSHHGSETSTIYPFLREVMPEYAVISCGKNNSYGHPDENLLSRLRDADAMVFRTDMQGTITATSDGKTVTFTTERNADAQTNPTENEKAAATPPATQPGASIPTDAEQTAETGRIGNRNTRVYHAPDCKSLPNEKNRVYFDTREEAEAAGMKPHEACGA